jgi:hypothetical protein
MEIVVVSKSLTTRHEHLLSGLVLIGLSFFMISGCGGLPSDFENLDLEQQVEAYERNFERLGGPQPKARSYISWHGFDAASIMEQYLDGRRSGIPKEEAANIIHDVQLRGCSLTGTEIEESLRRVLENQDLTRSERMAIGSALTMIERDVSVENYDLLTGGPCSAQTEGTPSAHIDAGTKSDKLDDPRSGPEGTTKAEDENPS